MTEKQLEHLIRASGAILGEDAVVVIGSQSILPWLRKFSGHPPRSWPGVFTLSTEADIIPIDNDERKSDLIDGSLGEDSYFHNSYGYYAQGVSMETAMAPEGWLSRCYPLVNANTHQVVGHCMHPADLFIAKSIANRPKDGPFLDAMIATGLVNKKTVSHLLKKVPEKRIEEQNALLDQVTARFKRVIGPDIDPQSANSGQQKITRCTGVLKSYDAEKGTLVLQQGNHSYPYDVATRLDVKPGHRVQIDVLKDGENPRVIGARVRAPEQQKETGRKKSGLEI
jgi:hypothetical protein